MFVDVWSYRGAEHAVLVQVVLSV